jgi:hypothetical protein
MSGQFESMRAYYGPGGMCHGSQPLNPGLGTQRYVYRHGICAIHQPDTSNELEQPCNAKARIPGQETSGNFRGVDQGEADKNDHHGDVSGTPKNVNAKNAEKQECYGHPAIQLSAGIDISPVSHREPVNAVSGESESCHIQGSRFAEYIEPRQSGEQVDAREELHEARHPETP